MCSIIYVYIHIITYYYIWSYHDISWQSPCFVVFLGWIPTISQQWSRHHRPFDTFRNIDTTRAERSAWGDSEDERGEPKSYTGVSENSVPLNPMVNDHYPYISLLNGYFIGNINPTFSDKPIRKNKPPTMEMSWDSNAQNWVSTCFKRKHIGCQPKNDSSQGGSKAPSFRWSNFGCPEMDEVGDDRTSNSKSKTTLGLFGV